VGRTKGAKNKPKVQTLEVGTDGQILHNGKWVSLEEATSVHNVNQKSIIKPGIKVKGETHLFEDMEKDGELPVLVSVGMAKVHPNSKDWVSYKIKSRGKEILAVEVSEPDQKLIALDCAKVEFVNAFQMDDGILV
jgi:hypothetical protein